MSIRSFIAIEIPDEIKESLRRTQQQLRSADVKVRWVDHRNIHLTMKFLGDVSDSDIPKICEVVKAAAAATPPFGLEVAGLGTFPRKGPPRIIWAGVEGALETLGRLAEDIEGGLAEEVGIRPEHRAYHPHLTLGRVKSTRGVDQLAQTMRKCDSSDFGGFTAKNITLFMSELSPGGAIHTPMATMAFEG